MVTEAGASPRPHPATHLGYSAWEAGWGRGLAPHFTQLRQIHAHEQEAADEGQREQPRIVGAIVEYQRHVVDHKASRAPT